MEKLYDTTEEILEEDGKGDTNSIIMGDWNSVVGEESHKNMDLADGITGVKCSLTFVKEMG